MLKIGEFSTLTGISINMLRNYDRMGLLQPATIDDNSGYRYYNEEQIALAKRIQMFKDLGFSLKDIPRLNAFSPAEVQYLISQKIIEKQAELSQLEEQIRRMKQARDNYELYASHSFNISKVKMPARQVVSMKMNLRSQDEEIEFFNEFLEKCQINNVEVLHLKPVYAITHSSDYIYNYFKTEIQIPVAEEPSSTDDFDYLEINSREVAEVTFDGTEEELIQVNKFVGRYAGGMGYQVLGAPMRQIGVITANGLKPHSEEGHLTYYYPISQLY